MASQNPDPSFQTIRLSTDGDIAWLTLARPEHGNAINAAMAAELAQATQLLEQQAELACVVLTGEDRHFCLGGDLHEFSGAGEQLPDYVRTMLTDLHRAIRSLVHMAPITIAAVNGTAAGAGLSLLCATDLAISTESARYTLAYTRVGLSPDGASTWLLPRIIGTRRAREMAYTNRLLTAMEALEWGLVNQVVQDEDLLAETTNVIDRIKAASLPAQLTARALLRESGHNQLDTQMELEGHNIVNAARHPDAKEGITAQLAKRPPAFAHTR
jgi:2-(1,2-epoxy-1,2-dihydrophenyl)acetyl-CoA isomerase